MNSLQRAKNILKRPLIAAVPISSVVFDDKKVYVVEGFGGKPIEHWPVYRFFELYLADKKAEAHEAYQAWYREQFAKYNGVPKREGGMQGGSLERAITRAAAQGISRAEAERVGIATRVAERFALLESIRQKGYLVHPNDLIHGVSYNGKVHLKNGHHRAAALKLLGYTEIPSVVVLPSWLGNMLGY